MSIAVGNPQPHSAGFGTSLLTLLRGAAGQEVDHSTDVIEHDSNEDTSTFAADMLSSLPSHDSSDDQMHHIEGRSDPIAQVAAAEEETIDGTDKTIEGGSKSFDEEDEAPLFGEKQANQAKPPSPEQKFKWYLDEFGRSGLDSVLGHDEQYIADVTAYYVDDVIVKGYALLTSHRFLYLAYLPKKAPEMKSKETVVQAGMGYFHSSVRRVNRRRVWFELKKDLLVGYPGSQRLYEPLGSIRICHMKNLAKVADGAKEVHFTVRGDRCWMQFDTNEAAISWHRELAGLIWQSKHQIDTLKIVVPLPRIAQFSTSSFMDICEVMAFEVDQSVSRHDEKDKLNTLNVGVHLSVSDGFIPPLREAWEAARHQIEKYGVDLHKVPLAILDLQDPVEEEPEGPFHHLLHHHPRHDSQEDGPVSRHKYFMINEFSLTGDPEEMHNVVHGIPHGGYLLLTSDHLCFYSRRMFKAASSATRIKIPLSDIKDAQHSRSFRWHCYGIKLVLEAHKDVDFELHEKADRDNLIRLMKSAIAAPKRSVEERPKEDAMLPTYTSTLGQLLEQDILVPRHALNKLRNFINVDLDKHMKLPPMRIACLTIGSRGDVQPYIALCKSLMEHGHRCVIVSHPEYKDWVNKNGIEFRPAGGDPGILMKLSVENKMFSPTFFTETLGKFREWLDELLREILEQCHDVDLIIESPSTFGGIHVAEVLEIGYMRAFTMPWTKTSAYPQAFSVPSVDLGAGYNSMSYELYEQVIWLASEGQINRWRKHMLGLAPTTLAKLDLEHVPFMYNFSPGVVPPPLDWGNLTTVTGYWNLASSNEDWQAPSDLIDFLDNARKEEKKVAYIGFGSITIPNAHKTMQMIFDAAQQSGVYCVISKGWSDRMEESSTTAQKPYDIPDHVYVVDSIPHDWLFPRIDIAMHHGGAGTTGASLANKLVTLIHPFFGDQFFWAGRVEKLGAGKRVGSLKHHDVKQALMLAASDRLMAEKAIRVGDAIKADHGVETARAFIYRHYDLSKRKARRADHTTSKEISPTSSPAPRRALRLGSKREKQPSGERPDSGLVIVLVDSASDEEPAKTPTDQSKPESGGGYSSKRAKQQDIDRRLSLLDKCRAEGKTRVLSVLNPEGHSEV